MSVNLLIFKVFGDQRGIGNIARDGFIVFSLFGFVVVCCCDELSGGGMGCWGLMRLPRSN
jgi:hypothetical protein